MKYIVFDILENLKNSSIGKATITSNPLDSFCDETHPYFIIMESEDFKDDGIHMARVIGENIILANGKIGKVNVLKGNLCVFTPDSNFKTLRTGWICQMEMDKIKEQKPRGGSFFILCEKPGPKDWQTASFDSDGTVDFRKDVTKGTALIDNFDKLA